MQDYFNQLQLDALKAKIHETKRGLLLTYLHSLVFIMRDLRYLLGNKTHR